MTYEFGAFRMDSAKRVLWRAGQIVPLPPKALDVLSVLVERSGDVVSKQELLERVWPATFVEEANLSVNVSILRKALSPEGDGEAFIQTLSRRGYRFVVPTRRIEEVRPTLASLAVLPFRPIVPNEEDEALGFGMTDALITRLSRLGQVVVRATGAVAKHAGSDPHEAGRALRVDAVVDGRLQRLGTRLRLTVQLVTVEEGAPAWADKIETDATDPFAAQDEVAERLATALALRLEAPDRALLAKRSTASVAAYQAYARGRLFWSRLTAESVGRAIACFQEAAEHDPTYAPPHAGLADAYMVLGFSGVLSPRDAWPLARAEAAQSLALDPRLAEPRVAQAYVRLFEEWDWVGAEADLRQAVEVSPQSAAAHQWLGLFHLMRGRMEDARTEIETAEALDPVSIIIHTIRGFERCLAGDHEAEAEQYRATLELDPGQFLGSWGLGIAATHLGRFDEAEAALRLAVEATVGAPFMRWVLAWSLASAGRLDAARDEIRPMDSRDPSSYASPYQRATVLAALGEADAALAALEEAERDRDPWLALLFVDPMLEGLHGRPQFDRLTSRVGAVPRRTRQG